MLKRILIVFAILCSVVAFPADWSFSGGYIYFDNSLTQWSSSYFMLIIGDNGWSSVHYMEPDVIPNRYKCALPLRGWGNATYMAVIADDYIWDTGAWDKNNLKNAKHYTAPYESGLHASAGQGYLFTPQTNQNGTKISLTYLGEGFHGIKFTTQEKNSCQRLEGDSAITLIFATAASRFNQPFTEVKKIYVYGPTTLWETKEEFRLTHFSDDSCFYRTFKLSEVERPGNSGQPEFKFMVYKTDGSQYEVRAHSSWECGIDSRLVFINRCDNIMMLLPGDDINELGKRRTTAIEIRPLSEWGTIEGDSVKECQISNFRRVPGTRNLYRSYHPYSPDNDYDTEEARFHFVRNNGLRVGIQSDICLSGDMSYREGETYSCGGVNKTVTISDYYRRIMQAGHILIVGKENGYTPDFNTCIYQTNKQRYGEWIKEIVHYINDETHPMPFQIHCALGGDRTGAISATIAALCGAEWEDIMRDYEATSDIKIQQYRHRNLIRYCLHQMLGQSPDSIVNLQEAMQQYMVTNGYLTEGAIDSMITRLNRPLSVTYTVVVPEGTPSVYMSATWNYWKWTPMVRVDATHFSYTRMDATPACEYKYSAQPSWDYEDISTKGTANRLWQETDTVPAWKNNPTTDMQRKDMYKNQAPVGKYLRDGQIYIRNGKNKTYTTYGSLTF